MAFICNKTESLMVFYSYSPNLNLLCKSNPHVIFTFHNTMNPYTVTEDPRRTYHRIPVMILCFYG